MNNHNDWILATFDLCSSLCVPSTALRRINQSQGLDAAEISSPYWKAGDGLDHDDDVILKMRSCNFLAERVKVRVN